MAMIRMIFVVVVSLQAYHHQVYANLANEPLVMLLKVN